MCYRIRKCMEISIYHRKIWWSIIRFNLSIFPCGFRTSYYGNGIFHWSCFKTKHWKSPKNIGTKRNKMASLWSSCNYRKLFFNVFLHNNCRLAFVLLFFKYYRSIFRIRCKRCRKLFWKFNSKSRTTNFLDGFSYNSFVCNSWNWFKKWR